jgi:uncharacterized protein (DUF1800 family)
MTTPEIRKQIAHVFRRCGFGPTPGAVEAWEEHGPQALIEELLSREAIEYRTEAKLYDGFNLSEDDDDDYKLFELAVASIGNDMVHGSNPIHERMTWYWSTHLTSSNERADSAMMWRQYQLFRQHALGHFPTLMRQVTTDAAMLLYLDGAESRGTNPNENYAREFLELFTLGRNGGYTEDDVRAAARILSGWWVDWETAEVHYKADQAYTRPVTFMGERRRWNLDEFIEFVCSRPSCAQHVATRIYHHLVGPDLTDDRRDELAAVFVANGMEIKPLVAEMVRGDDFLAATHSRARQPVEWLIAARQALGLGGFFDQDERWHLEVLGQMPFLPPNVAGWPLDDRWASASQIIARTSVAMDWDMPERLYDEIEPTVDAVLARCGIYDPSESTQAALKQIEADVSEYDGRLELLLLTAIVTPEFTLL